MSLLNTDIKANYYFETICGIPHPSFHEDKIANYVENFAKERGLRYIRDALNNIIIYADATPGYEEHDVVILQGHMDMVPSKVPESTHNFETDPLDLYVEDGWLKAKGTTLGGDDGVAVAYMLAILDEDIPHPALECIFTTQEEVGLNGAVALDWHNIHGKRLISLDETDFGVCCTSALGGRVIDIHKDVTYTTTSQSGYALSIDGLLSGHSSADIHQERANAIKVLVRILNALDNVQISSFNAGSADNVIPGSGTVSFTCDNEDAEIIIQQMIDDIEIEYENTDPGMNIVLKTADLASVMTLEDSQKLIDYLYVMPNGCFMYSRIIRDFPIYSSNIGTVRTNENGIAITIFYRSSIDSQR
ncbi:MAG: M20/M25/M40 family metallo-hydrolase, partial [Erysipelotrichaceae bacterium]|nr:M20/M25/M40 family metallo-hydrolase [Erysipelotrichaceae bacterium]